MHQGIQRGMLMHQGIQLYRRCQYYEIYNGTRRRISTGGEIRENEGARKIPIQQIQKLEINNIKLIQRKKYIYLKRKILFFVQGRIRGLYMGVS